MVDVFYACYEIAVWSLVMIPIYCVGKLTASTAIITLF